MLIPHHGSKSSNENGRIGEIRQSIVLRQDTRLCRKKDLSGGPFSGITPPNYSPTAIKKPLFLLLSLPFVLSAPAAVLLNDHFSDGDPATNSGLGFTIHDGGGWPVVETESNLRWTGDPGWNWGGTNLQSNNEYGTPVGGSYRVTWAVGPFSVTTPSDQSYGDIRMQLSLVSANLAQGSGSSEMWPATAGVIVAEVLYKQGQNPGVALWTKDASMPADSNGTYQTDIASNAINPDKRTSSGSN